MAEPWRPTRYRGNAAGTGPAIPSHYGGGEGHQRSNRRRCGGLGHPNSGYGYRGDRCGRKLRQPRGDRSGRDGRRDAGEGGVDAGHPVANPGMEHRAPHRCGRLLDQDRRSVGKRVLPDAKPVLCPGLERRWRGRATGTDQRRPPDCQRKSRHAASGSRDRAQWCQRHQRSPKTSSLCCRGRPQRGIHCRRRLIGHRHPR
ncbi:conserved hypothetical protein [Mycobacterium marinum E11]|nr:conserved hypothetical protein [Mycobacterium marinum E11]